ncbi:hypothetical protein EYM_06495 [Ignicoccus islandicus DSM 13165]|uniref:DUF2192 domain-containing protein n=1 Tax=Ignicoccus islandicus DSM 13165 TaxID=940295 RepID=A0A0U3DWS5_9CREN|nr:DUF2192 domain-containing protein [Ignicoccus islandicus]ALU11946.1 hypothetical protein EYM_06495 [Ignicoccus islandicus DSM 13165]
MIYKKKIEVAEDLLAEAMEENLNREEVKKRLVNAYKREGISPFRGLALPPDITDKEMATLYVIAKYGLGIEDELRDVFEYEERLEKAAELLLKGDREGVLKLVGEINSNTLSRIFRVVFTAVILGFKDEKELIELLHKAMEVFPEEEKTARKYARFYIAFRVAEGIAKGEIRDKLDKEALKQSLSLRIGIPKVLPDDEYVYIIAKEVFNLDDSVLKKILKIVNKRKGTH